MAESFGLTGDMVRRFDADMREARDGERGCNLTDDLDGITYYCTRPAGHYGTHAAHGWDDLGILHTWRTFDPRLI